VVNDSAAPPAALTPEQSGLLRLVYGAQAAQIIYVAAKLGVPDILKDGPRTSAGTGAAVEVEASTLRRVLRGVSSLGVCAEVEADRFALTEMGASIDLIMLAITGAPAGGCGRRESLRRCLKRVDSH
jgi:hypothetical protein